MASLMRKPRKYSPGEYETPLSDPSVVANLGKRSKFIYLFPEFVSESGSTEKPVVKHLEPLLANKAVGFSKVQDITKNFQFKKDGAINFICGQRENMQEGLYAKSPYYTKPQHCEYLFVADRSMLLSLEIQRLTQSALAAYGFAKSLRFFSTVQTLQQINKEMSVAASALGLFNLGSGRVGSSKKGATTQDAEGSVVITPHPDLFKEGFRPSISPIVNTFLKKNASLRDVLNGNLKAIQRKDGAPAYIDTYTMSFAFLRSSEYLIYGGVKVPVTEGLSLGISAKKKKFNEDFEVLDIVIKFEKPEVLRKKCVKLVQRGEERIVSPCYHNFKVDFDSFFAEKSRRGIRPKTVQSYFFGDSICATMIGPKQAGKSSTIHTAHLAFMQKMDISAQWFRDPPAGVKVRLAGQKRLEDGTDEPGVTEVKVYSGAKSKHRLVLQDTIGLIPTESVADVKKYYKAWFENINQGKYSYTIVPDVIVYVLNGLEVATVALDPNATKQTKAKVRKDIQQANDFLRLMHVKCKNDIKVPFVFLLTKGDIVNEAKHQKATIAYLRSKLVVEGVPVQFIRNLRYGYPTEKEIVEMKTTNSKLYGPYKKRVETAYDSAITAAGIVVREARAHIRERSQQDYEIAGGETCTIL